jgi:hypothetical protein
MPKMRVRGIVLGSNIIRLDCPIPLSEGAAVEVVVDVHSSDNTNNPISPRFAQAKACGYRYSPPYRDGHRSPRLGERRHFSCPMTLTSSVR